MLGSAYWELWVILFAVIAANLLLRLLFNRAVRGTLSPLQLAVAMTSLYVTVAAVAVGLGLYWLLTTDLANLTIPTFVQSSLLVLVIVVWAIIAFLRDGQWIWYARASTLLRTHQYSEALSAAERILRRRRTLVQGWYLKALALAGLDQPTAALDAMDHTLECIPSNDTSSGRRIVPRATVLSNKGFLLVTLHHGADALAVCDEALTLAPENTTAWAYKAAVLQRMGQRDEALEAALHVVDDETGRTRAEITAYALSVMAAAFNDLGRYDDALAVAERGMTLHPHPHGPGWRKRSRWQVWDDQTRRTWPPNRGWRSSRAVSPRGQTVLRSGNSKLRCCICWAVSPKRQPPSPTLGRCWHDCHDLKSAVAELAAPPLK